jgi:RNA recognition motif-containing protein
MWRGSSGFAFLNFKTKQEAEEALVALEGLHFDDRDLRLEMAKERESNESGGGSRRRRQRGDSRSGDEEEDARED